MTVIVLFGGRSDERHVSVATGQNVARTLGSPLCWFWAPDGSVSDVSPSELLAHQRPFEIDFQPSRPAIWPDLEQALDTLPVDDPVLLLALHGGEGEDGTVQRMLEQRGIPFTGSGSEASAAAFDKERAKNMVKGRVSVAQSRTIAAGNRDAIRKGIEDMLQDHDRIVLKPLAAGSSRGLFFLDRGSNIDDIVEKVAALRLPYLFEQFIRGRELTVGVADLGDGPVALPVIEIVVEAGHSFDYEGKYLGKGTREICPADIPDEMARAAQETAVTAHIALGCEGYSRTDIMAASDGPYFLELNTLPGLTTSSLVPQELKEAGIDFREFLEQQIELGRRRVSTREPSQPRR
ncbi:MAG TPA: ATP-grasp domain-containing protein [Thermoanaerobaculia bacterium]|nr:ATP-grasp domain-containing protein [Thermoanaerobaculia bacterium]